MTCGVSIWRAHDPRFPVTSVVQGRKWRLLGVVWSPEVGGSWRAPGRPCAGRSEPAKTEAAVAAHVWRGVQALLEPWLFISSTCLLKPHSRTVEDSEFLCSEIRLKWGLVARCLPESGRNWKARGLRAHLDAREGY